MFGWPFLPQAARKGDACYKNLVATRQIVATRCASELKKSTGEGEESGTMSRSWGGTDTAKGQGKSQRPLAEYVRFATKRGMVLVYDPAPLDSWIGKAVYFDQTKKKHVDSGLPSQAKSHSLLSGPTGRGEQPSIWPRS